MKKHFVNTISPTAMLANPHRNFTVNPITQEVVDTLIASYEESGDMGVIPVRQSPDNPRKYEIVAGHHRHEALTQMGKRMIDVKVCDYDDMEMLTYMIAENATQYGGNPASQLDAVQAVIRQVAYALRICDNNADLGRILQRSVYASERAFETAKGTLLEQGLIGRDVIVKMTGFKEHTVKGALKELQGTGFMSELLADVEALVAEEMQAASDEEARIIAEAEAAEKQAAKDAEIERKAAIKRKAEAEALAKRHAEAKQAADRKRIENEQKQAAKAELDRKKRAKLQAEELKRQETARKAAEATAFKRAEDRERAAEAQAKIEQDAWLNPEASNLFHIPTQRTAFINGLSHFKAITTYEGQVELAEALLDGVTDDETGESVHLTVEGIRRYFVSIRQAQDKEFKAEQERKRKAEAKKSAERQAVYLMEELSAASVRFGSAINSLQTAINKDPEIGDWLANKASLTDLRKRLNALEDSIPRLRNAIGMKDRVVTARPAAKLVN